MILSDKHPCHFNRALSNFEKNLASEPIQIKYVSERSEEFQKFVLISARNMDKCGIHLQRQLSKSVSSSPRSLSFIYCLIMVEMLPFLAKKSQQSNHKMGNFSCYKKLLRYCLHPCKVNVFNSQRFIPKHFTIFLSYVF